MIKNILISLFIIYGLFITIKYLEVNFKYQKLKKRFDELQMSMKPDTIKIYEIKATKDTIIRYVLKKEFKLDTIYVYQVFHPFDEKYTTFSWRWKNFLTLEDTFFLKFDEDKKMLTGRLQRYYKVEKPINVDIFLFERKPFDLWWRVFINPSDMSEYISFNFRSDLKRYHLYSGFGVQIGKKIYPTINFALLYNKHLFGFDVSLEDISLNYKFAIN